MPLKDSSRTEPVRSREDNITHGKYNSIIFQMHFLLCFILLYIVKYLNNKHNLPKISCSKSARKRWDCYVLSSHKPPPFFFDRLAAPEESWRWHVPVSTHCKKCKRHHVNLSHFCCPLFFSPAFTFLCWFDRTAFFQGSATCPLYKFANPSLSGPNLSSSCDSFTPRVRRGRN